MKLSSVSFAQSGTSARYAVELSFVPGYKTFDHSALSPQIHNSSSCFLFLLSLVCWRHAALCILTINHQITITENIIPTASPAILKDPDTIPTSSLIILNQSMKDSTYLVDSLFLLPVNDNDGYCL